jgi:CheY-like chemotaxis protein
MAVILVVDDNAMMRTVLRGALRRAGHEVTVAEDGERALAAVSTHGPFDLIITDIEMPGLDGRGLLRALRETSCGSPVILMSGHHGDSELARLVGGDSPAAQAALEKPFTAERLISKVAEVIGSSGSAGFACEAISGKPRRRQIG